MKYNPIKKLYIYYIKGKFAGTIEKTSYLGCWIEEGDSFLFFSSPAEDILNSIIDTHKGLILKDTFEVDYFDWIGGKIKGFETGNIRIIPIWEQKAIKKSTDILLDPGVVFGAGNHETTKNCILGLNFLFSNFNGIENVLDLGCGTGILSLVCARLGAKRILAVDLNPLATLTTKKNIELNKMHEKILVIQAKAQEFVGKGFELLVANIHFDVLKELVKLLKFNDFKYLVFSGIFPIQAREIVHDLILNGIKIYEVFGLNTGWPTIVGGKE